MTEPRRLRDEAGPDQAALREALRSARSHVPSAALFEELARGALIRAASREAAAPDATPSGRSPARRARYIVVLSVLGLITGLATLAYRATTPAPIEPRTSSPSVSAPKTQAPTSSPDEQRAAPSAPPAAPERVPRAIRARARSQTESAVPSGDSADEVQLLQRARKLVLSSPARALALAERHEREFAHGLFREEREALAIEALWRLGQTPRARQRLQAFLTRYPRSVYRARLEPWLAPGAE